MTYSAVVLLDDNLQPIEEGWHTGFKLVSAVKMSPSGHIHLKFQHPNYGLVTRVLYYPSGKYPLDGMTPEQTVETEKRRNSQTLTNVLALVLTMEELLTVSAETYEEYVDLVLDLLSQHGINTKTFALKFEAGKDGTVVLAKRDWIKLG